MIDNKNKISLNIVFMGGFSYPHGMAGTKRIQHALDALTVYPDVSLRVIVLTQSSSGNALNGTHKGISYQTVMGNLFQIKWALLFPIFYMKARKALKGAYRENCINIIYNYGPPDLSNAAILAYARHLGYKIVFDIVEDYDVAMNISRSLFHRIKMAGIRFLKRYIRSLASGLIVISTHLEKKYRKRLDKSLPFHFRPVSVDFSYFTDATHQFHEKVTLFYAGSFGRKDGVCILLDAFDRVAARRNNVRLVLTGKGSNEMMYPTFERIKASPFRDRIEYKGYLDDDDYYAALNEADIPCMTRIDSAYANAGFPFKLGEFLATGKPVIASYVSNIAELLSDRETAVLVKPGDSDSIAQAVDYLIENPEKAISIGNKGKKTARRLFDCHAQGHDLIAFMRQLQ